jgi:hypothetical protein
LICCGWLLKSGYLGWQLAVVDRCDESNMNYRFIFSQVPKVQIIGMTVFREVTARAFRIYDEPKVRYAPPRLLDGYTVLLGGIYGAARQEKGSITETDECDGAAITTRVVNDQSPDRPGAAGGQDSSARYGRGEGVERDRERALRGGWD